MNGLKKKKKTKNTTYILGKKVFIRYVWIRIHQCKSLVTWLTFVSSFREPEFL